MKVFKKSDYYRLINSKYSAICIISNSKLISGVFLLTLHININININNITLFSLESFLNNNVRSWERCQGTLQWIHKRSVAVAVFPVTASPCSAVNTLYIISGCICGNVFSLEVSGLLTG